MRDVDAEARVSCDCGPYANRLALALCVDGGRAFVVDRRPRSPIRRVVDEDAVDRRRALKPGSGVDDVARGHAFAGVGPRIERDERFASRDPDS